MVKIFSATIAALTMIAFLMHVGATKMAVSSVLDHVLNFGQGGVQNVGVHRVEHGDLHVGYYESQDQGVIESKQDIKYHVVNLGYRLHQEYRMQDHHEPCQYES